MSRTTHRSNRARDQHDKFELLMPLPADVQPRKGRFFSRWFNKFSAEAARQTGHPMAFCLAFFVVITWALTGPLFNYSDTWQLVINTGTTIVTFLMVFLIQNTQNRDVVATQIKLDELIRALSGAHNALLDLEQMEDEELQEVRKQYEDLAQRSRELLQRGKSDCETPEEVGQAAAVQTSAKKNSHERH